MYWTVLLAALLIVALYGVSLYNALVRLKHNLSKAWSNIDVLLKQRHDELPKLVEVYRQYMGFESDALERVIQARSQVQTARDAGDIQSPGGAESALRMGLTSLFAVAEAYPDLKADNGFQHLRTRISTLENEIADRPANSPCRADGSHRRLQPFPSLAVARQHGMDSCRGDRTNTQRKPFIIAAFTEDALLQRPGLRALFTALLFLASMALLATLTPLLRG